MKKVIFMLINMNVGGTEKALLNMISEMPKEKFDITILLLEEFGGFLDSIPNHIHVEYLRGYNQIKNILNQPLHVTAINFFKSGNWRKAVMIMFFYLLTKIMKERSTFFKYVSKDFDPIEMEYDIAVAYAGPMDFISYFVINKIKAKKKIQWIHFDITKIGFNLKFAAKLYQMFDQIFVVSKEGKHKLIKYLPNLSRKIDTFYNIVSPNSIEKMANEDNGFIDNFDGVRILTVGRLTKEKGQDLTIHVLKKLKKAGYNVRWYCIGEGNARREYETLIENTGVKNDFILLGEKTNPYPFMKQCNIYVQPSRHEGFCITLAEAKCFNRPIVTTNFTGAKEQVTHGKTGFIVEFNEDRMFEAIELLIEDKDLNQRIQKSQEEMIDTSVEIEKIFAY